MAFKKPPVNIDISAGAKLNVDIKTEIPKESSGRLFDAITDAIRPFTEKRGLKADQIRLQREEIMIEIAQRAQERLAIENVSPKPISTRVLVPLLEKASLTDEDSDELKMAWTNLLASASRDGEKGVAIYSDTLSKLDPIHVKFLEEFGKGKNGKSSDLFLWLEKETMEKIITDEYQSLPNDVSQQKAAESLDKSLSVYFSFGGAALVAGGLGNFELESRYPKEEFGSDVYYALEALSILTVEKVRGDYSASANHIWLKVSKFTPFGFDLFQACSDVKFLRTNEEIEIIDRISLLTS